MMGLDQVPDLLAFELVACGWVDHVFAGFIQAAVFVVVYLIVEVVKWHRCRSSDDDEEDSRPP